MNTDERNFLLNKPPDVLTYQPNPIDEAIRTRRQFHLSGYQKQDEIPYDFLRRRLSISVSHHDTQLIVTKGALANVLAVCSSAEAEEGIVDIGAVREPIQKHFEEYSLKGFRTLGVAYRNMEAGSRISKDDEAGMTFLGFLVFFDPPKPNMIETIGSLKNLGVSLKIITGDNHLVAANVSQQMGLAKTKIITGPALLQMSDGALLKQVVDVDVFAEIEPNQKERIILALRKAGTWGTWATASMMLRRSMRPTLVFPLRAPWMWPKMRLISFYSKRSWACWYRVCGKGGQPLRTR